MHDATRLRRWRLLPRRSSVAAFHERYYASRVWLDTYWLGVQTQKCALDLWSYQELLAANRPV